MQIPQVFEQMTRSLNDPQAFKQWFSGELPVPGGPNATSFSPTAWVRPMEAWLHGAEILRHMQLDTIHRTQQRASQLSRSLCAAHDQGETVAALQNFAQENFRDAMTYWATNQQIVRDTELSTIADATKVAEQGQPPAAKPVRVAARRRKSTRR